MRSSMSTTAVEVVFQNNAGTKLALFWVNSEGREIPISTVEVEEELSMGSFVGHVWRGRDVSSETLVFEHLLSKGAGQGKEYTVDISACEGLPAAVDADDAEWLQVHGKRTARVAEGCQLDAMLSKEISGRMSGFHVFCPVLGAGGDVERLCIFAEGVDSEVCSHSVALQGDDRMVAIEHLVRMRVAPKWKMAERAPRPAIFTASGRQLPDEFTLAQAGVPDYRRALVLILGGVWHWPGIREGFERPMHAFVQGATHRLVLKTLSLRPRVFGITHFIADSEVDRTLEVAGPKVAKSQVSVKDADQGKDVDTWRTSSNFFMSTAGDPLLEALDLRVQNLTRVPITHSEYTQVLRYGYDERYVAHTDYFDPKDYQKDKGTLKMTANGVWNRLLTVFMYMSDVSKGGETYFPRYGGVKGRVPFDRCDMGYSVKPERRKVIIFYNMHPDGKLDADSLHGGCKVKNGTKWSANFWVWNVPQNFKRGKTHLAMAQRLGAWDESMDRVEEQVFSEFAAALPDKEEL